MISALKTNLKTRKCIQQKKYIQVKVPPLAYRNGYTCTCSYDKNGVIAYILLLVVESPLPVLSGHSRQLSLPILTLQDNRLRGGGEE